MSGNSHLRRRKKPQQNLKKIKERVITILKYTEYSVQHNKNTLSNSITVGFYVKGPGEPAVNVTKHAWGCCSRWTEESLAPSQSERHMSGAVESRRMNLAVLPAPWKVCFSTWSACGAHCHQGQEHLALAMAPVPAGVQHLGERPCPPHLEPWPCHHLSPSPMPRCHWTPQLLSGLGV